MLVFSVPLAFQMQFSIDRKYTTDKNDCTVEDFLHREDTVERIVKNLRTSNFHPSLNSIIFHSSFRLRVKIPLEECEIDLMTKSCENFKKTSIPFVPPFRKIIIHSKKFRFQTMETFSSRLIRSSNEAIIIPSTGNKRVNSIQRKATQLVQHPVADNYQTLLLKSTSDPRSLAREENP